MNYVLFITHGVSICRLQAGRLLHSLAGSGATRGRVHRVEPLPPAGSSGPPYCLVQFTLEAADALKRLPHEGTAKISRGAVCLIRGTSDLFISLASRGEHDGWETAMTVVGYVAEPALATLVEQKMLRLPVHNFTHPEYGASASASRRRAPVCRTPPCRPPAGPPARLPLQCLFACLAGTVMSMLDTELSCSLRGPAQQ